MRQKFIQRYFSKSKLGYLLKLVTAAIVVFVPLYPKFPLLGVAGSQVSIRLEDFIMLAGISVFLLAKTGSYKDLMEKKVYWYVYLFLAIGFFSLLSGIFLTQTVKAHLGFLHWLRRVEYLAALFIGIGVLKSRRDLAFFVKLLLPVTLFLFVYGVGQKYLDWPVITTQNAEYAKGVAFRYISGGHLVSTFAGHYDLASFIILIAPLFLCLVLSKKALVELAISQRPSLARAVFFISFGFLTWLLINAASRISIISFIVALIVSLALVKRYKAIPLVIVGVILVVSFSSNLLDRYTRIIKVTVDNLIGVAEMEVNAAEGNIPRRREASPTPASVVNPIFEDRSTSIRLNVEWPRAFRVFTKNPLLGTGYSSITLATDNDYLRVLGETGLFGLASFFLLLGKIGLDLWRIFKANLSPLSTVFLASLLGSFSGVLLNMVFIDILEASKFAIMFWLFVGFALSLAKINSYDK